MNTIYKRITLMAVWAGLLIQTVSAASYLVPVGRVIGLEIADTTLTVAAFDEDLGDRARDAGLRVGDRLLTVDRQPIGNTRDVQRALGQAHGSVELTVLRGEKILRLRMLPQSTEKGPKLGVYLKDRVTGIGTVTWYDPQSDTFGALGHGVSGAGGQLLPMEEGTAYDARILSVQKGLSGKPGQLIGAMDQKTGLLHKNTEQGVFGTCPQGWPGEKLPVAEFSQIRKGPATIRSTVSGELPAEYEVQILRIQSGAGGRNLLLQVTDPRLLESTGGIVQGMSGSPILQDGRIIGAVTHVLVNDPTKGYGIFIENMLDAAA